MEVVYSQGNIQVVIGDITEETTDAIVNAANSTLLGGGGVDGAIHRKAGPKLKEECRTLGGCPTGEAKITKGYQLKAKYVIHTVGPVWKGGNVQEDELLASCYKNSLQIAQNYGIQSISFPAISTGVYGFPKKRAAEIAVKEVKKFLKEHPLLVRFVCFDQETAQVYLEVLKNSNSPTPPF
ncbi:MAG: O-acetyl-ADP-ribose deacetylase [Atribacter sp.]|jgi:O-acetyl-ADP-ribose deacetylase (regulator of RNase III)|uniref:O-acetyl-ADP-ribose deacetylase n=1 Tax=Atribacter sp. TaxID=2847780 RepID=UPI003D985A70